MDKAKSFWLPDGRIIFAYLATMENYAPIWKVGVRSGRGDKSGITGFSGCNRRRHSEAESLADLREYARKNNLEPAY